MANRTEPLAEALMRYLRNQSVVVDRATSGFQAYSMAFLNDYDVVIIGNEMPGMNGKEVCEKLRDKGSSLPLMYWYSESSDVLDRIQALENGADVCMANCSDFSEVSTQLIALRRRKKHWKRSVYQVHGVTIDCNRMMLFSDRKQLSLSPKEFRILEYLGSHQGKVMSRSQVLENVWGSDGYALSNVIDVHMSRLRRKINHSFDVELIETVRGGGYLLREAGVISEVRTSPNSLKQ